MAQPFNAEAARKMTKPTRLSIVMPEVYDMIAEAAAHGSNEVEFDEPFTDAELHAYYQGVSWLMGEVESALKANGYTVKPVARNHGSSHRVAISWEKTT